MRKKLVGTTDEELLNFMKTHTISEIARRFNMSRQGVVDYAKRHTIALAKRCKVLGVLKSDVEKCVLEGYSTKKIAAKFGWTRKQTVEALRRMGFKRGWEKTCDL